MSRTNPYKKKRRSAKRTLLMYGEGLGEEVFLKHLRSLYAYNSGVSVTIRNGKGGNPKSVVVNAINEPGDFKRRIVVLDNDKKQKEMKQACDEAKKKRVEILENSPCLEATLLSILRPGQNFSTKQSAWCKSEFETNYMDKKKRTELAEYIKIFSKQVLDNQRSNIAELNAFISIMENG
ncbi:RloB domain-containing protein [Patescibacteria group bacterium]|nr:RloB domain-containing protein [Patescibacteria group bacterium]